MGLMTDGCARMAELADAPDSKSGSRKRVGVRPSLWAPNKTGTYVFTKHSLLRGSAQLSRNCPVTGREHETPRAFPPPHTGPLHRQCHTVGTRKWSCVRSASWPPSERRPPAEGFLPPSV